MLDRLKKLCANFPDLLPLVKVLAADSPIGIQVYDSEGHSVYTNEQHTKVYGGPPPPTYSVLKDEIVAAAGFMETVRAAFAGKTTELPVIWYDTASLQENLSSKDRDYIQKVGKKCAIAVRLVPVFDDAGNVPYVIFFHNDVTAEVYMKQERERALKERDDAKALVQKVLDQTKAVIYIKALDGKFIFVNEQFCRIFNMSREQILGRTNHELFPKEIADILRANDVHVLNTRSALEIEETVVHSDGKRHSYISLKFPLEDSTGAPQGLGGVSTDITQYRLLEKELSNAKRMETIGILAGGVAHDFGNILTTMVLNADFLLRQHGQPPSELSRSLEKIKTAGQRASLLIKQLLAFGGKRQIEIGVLDLNSILYAMRSILSVAMGEDIQFELNTPASVWPVLTDPVHFEQILTNLCLNARDAMLQGGTLRISTSNVALNGEGSDWRIGKPHGDFVELRVSDNGTGMPAEVVEQIFEPFFTTKLEGRGTGLGLASVKELIQKNGGDVRVESKVGEGTTFRVYFPRATSDAAIAARTAARGTALEQGSATILLVEDEAILRDTSATILKQAGYTVIEANNGRKGLELWRDGNIAVDLIVTDVIMPGLSGAEMIRLMSEVRPFEKTKVLFVSGYSEKKLSAHDFKQDSLHFLEKPYGADELLIKVQSVLKG